MTLAQSIAVLLALLGEPALAVGPHGACRGTVVAPGTAVFRRCALSTLVDAQVYVEPSEEALAGWTARAGRKPGRVVLTFHAEDVQ